MSESYRRLCQDLPPPVGGAVRFPADPKKVKAWVAGLPRANPQAAEQEIARALEGLSGQRLEGGQRFAALEELRGTALEAIVLLEGGFSGSSLPLPQDKARAAAAAGKFHLDLALGYRQAAWNLAVLGDLPPGQGPDCRLP